MSSISEEKNSSESIESGQEQSPLTEDGFVSASEDFWPYDENVCRADCHGARVKACLIETKGEEQTESMKEEPTKPPDVNIPVEEDYTSWRGETELRTNETLECRKRKQITEQLMDHQTEYNKKMKL